MHKYFKNKSKFLTGFTIIEVLVSLSIFIVITFFVAYLFKYNFWIYNSQTLDLNVANSARVAIDDINNYVRQANRVISTYSIYSTDSNQLVLQLVTIDNQSQPISGTYDIVVFYLTGTDLMRSVFSAQDSFRPAETKKIASNIDINNFSFTYDNADYSLVKEVFTNIGQSVLELNF